MQRMRGSFGIAQGEVMPFSDFENGGPMWTGAGAREVRRRVVFDAPFTAPPVVHLGVTMWDVSNSASLRLDLSAEAIDAAGFELRVGTWADSRIARLRVAWIAFGPCRDEEMWEVD
jgi:hypothetical protein